MASAVKLITALETVTGTSRGLLHTDTASRRASLSVMLVADVQRTACRTDSL